MQNTNSNQAGERTQEQITKEMSAYEKPLGSRRLRDDKKPPYGPKEMLKLPPVARKNNPYAAY